MQIIVWIHNKKIVLRDTIRTKDKHDPEFSEMNSEIIYFTQQHKTDIWREHLGTNNKTTHTL